MPLYLDTHNIPGLTADAVAQAHAADEFVALDDLDWAVDLLRAALY